MLIYFFFKHLTIRSSCSSHFSSYFITHVTNHCFSFFLVSLSVLQDIVKKTFLSFLFFNVIVLADDFVGITNKQSYLFLWNLLLFRSQPRPSSFRFLFANSHSSLLSRSLLRLVLVLVVVRPLFPRGGCGGVRTLRRVARREELRGRGRVRQHHTPEGPGEGGWGGQGESVCE